MNESALNFLENRKSVPSSAFNGVGPDKNQLDRIITIASRVPDHGRLEPWRFIIYRIEQGAAIGDALAARALEINPDIASQDLDREKTRFAKAPLTIGVISKAKAHPKIPDWEQFLSGGAAAMNICYAAEALGFGVNWVTGWYSDDAKARKILGLKDDERVVGFVQIGQVDIKVPDRPRPDINALMSDYSGPIT